MWLFTEKGFLSAVRKGHGDQNLVVRARNIAALKDLTEFSMTAIVRTPKADYPFRLHVSPETWAEYVKLVALEVDYRNFKTQVKKTLGQDHAEALGLVWKTMLALQDYDARKPLTAEYLDQPVDHYFYEVWSPNGECVSDGVCTVAELPQLRRNVEAEWLELVTWPQPKYVGPIVELSDISEQPYAPLVGAQWSPLIQVIAEMFQALGSDPERFMRVDFYSDKFSHPIYVQAKQLESGIITLEAISNKYLNSKLTERQNEAMLFLEWDIQESNFTATSESAGDLRALAEYVVNTFVTIYGIDESCSFGFSSSGSETAAIECGMRRNVQNSKLFHLPTAS
jgi:hypothetical protein